MVTTYPWLLALVAKGASNLLRCDISSGRLGHSVPYRARFVLSMSYVCEAHTLISKPALRTIERPGNKGRLWENESRTLVEAKMLNPVMSRRIE